MNPTELCTFQGRAYIKPFLDRNLTCLHSGRCLQTHTHTHTHTHSVLYIVLEGIHGPQVKNLRSQGWGAKACDQVAEVGR